MEDSDPNGTRKRPRLDSGSRVSEDLSIESASAAVPAVEMDITPDLVHDSNNSKMTINVKSPMPEMAAETTQSPVELPDTSAQPQSPELDPHSANVISISSSPAQSPEIEVADLEDMDSDPNTSSWRPLEEALREHSQPEVGNVEEEMDSLVDSFPSVGDKLSVRESLNRLCEMIEKGKRFIRGLDLTRPRCVLILSWF